MGKKEIWKREVRKHGWTDASDAVELTVGQLKKLIFEVHDRGFIEGAKSAPGDKGSSIFDSIFGKK